MVWGIFAVLFCLPENVIYGENRMFGFCLHKLLIGFDCPGCGMTRAIYSFIHLDFLKAIEFNVSIVLFIPLILLYTLEFFGLFNYSKFKFNHIYYSFIVVLSIVYAQRMLTFMML